MEFKKINNISKPFEYFSTLTVQNKCEMPLLVSIVTGWVLHHYVNFTVGFVFHHFKWFTISLVICCMVNSKVLFNSREYAERSVTQYGYIIYLKVPVLK